MGRTNRTPEEIFCTDQLIPYLGNKRKLLPFIRKAIEVTDAGSGHFLDLFAGSGVVSRLAKTMGYRVTANDWEPYSYYINRCYIGDNREAHFERLGGIENAFRLLNESKPLKGYIAKHYCPENTEKPDLENERLFFIQENGRKIDAIRELIREWKESGEIGESEFYILMASLLYQVSYRSNTSGVFKGFHRGFGGATKTALYRIMTPLKMEIPKFWDNGVDNEVIASDATEVAGEIEADIAYIDPPYNQHQYGANYHLLNTVALWDKPPLNRRIYVDGKRVKKAAIREDWKEKRRSRYCYNESAIPTFAETIEKVNTDWILISYSTDGIIPIEKMARILNERGETQLLAERYKRYRVSSQRPSTRGYNTELAFVVNTKKRGNKNRLSEILDTIKSLKTDGKSEKII